MHDHVLSYVCYRSRIYVHYVNVKLAFFQKIREQFLNPPSTLPYRMKKHKKTDPSHFQSKEVIRILKGKVSFI